MVDSPSSSGTGFIDQRRLCLLIHRAIVEFDPDVIVVVTTRAFVRHKPVAVSVLLDEIAPLAVITNTRHGRYAKARQDEHVLYLPAARSVAVAVDMVAFGCAGAENDRARNIRTVLRFQFRGAALRLGRKQRIDGIFERDTERSLRNTGEDRACRGPCGHA